MSFEEKTNIRQTFFDHIAHENLIEEARKSDRFHRRKNTKKKERVKKRIFYLKQRGDMEDAHRIRVSLYFRRGR